MARAIVALVIAGADVALFVTSSDSWRYVYLAAAVVFAGLAVAAFVIARRR
ncbi:MAG: hypothetical protein ACM31C_16970 [Acidobacteriota bacterium]